MTTPREMTILFADVAGSVQLHTALGDAEAHRQIVDTLETIGSLSAQSGGRVVEIIGDEIMCAFEAADAAFAAACRAQQDLHSAEREALYIRAGMHSGVTGEQDGHPFGDTVNIAARVAAVAKAGQVMLTGDSYRRLSPAQRSRTRYFSNVFIKGKREPFDIHQALWDPCDGTVVIDRGGVAPAATAGRVQLRHRDTRAILTEGSELLLGRGAQCDLQVETDAASRIHATLRCQAGKLVLADRSTNGTFVKALAGRGPCASENLFLHHKEWIASGSGVISLGRPVSNDNADLVIFECG